MNLTDRLSRLRPELRALVARLFLLTLGVLALGGAFFVIRPTLPADVRGRATDATPIAFAIGAIVGTGLWILERVKRRWTKRLNWSLIYGPMFLVIGSLVLLSSAGLFLVAVGAAGLMLPVVTPLARFRYDDEPAPTPSAKGRGERDSV